MAKFLVQRWHGYTKIFRLYPPEIAAALEEDAQEKGWNGSHWDDPALIAAFPPKTNVGEIRRFISYLKGQVEYDE